jgi:putative ABC transport system permease protein
MRRSGLPPLTTFPWHKVTVRLAMKAIRFDRGSAILIAAVVAIPVLAGAFFAAAQASSEPSVQQRVRFALGNADAIAYVTTSKALDPRSYATADTFRITPIGMAARDPVSFKLDQLLPPGVRAIPGGWVTSSYFRVGARSVDGITRTLDLRDAMTERMESIQSGVAPRRGREVAASTALARRLRLRLGDKLVVNGRVVTVVGLTSRPSDLNELAVVAPAGLFSSSASPVDGRGLAWLVALPPGQDTQQLRETLLHEGVLLVRRADFARASATSERAQPDLTPLSIGVAGFGLVEVGCIAGAAFAVSTRRRRRDLALLRASGATSRDLRTVVAVQGLLLGALGTIGGLTAGVGLAFAARDALEQHLGHVMGPVRIQPAAVTLIGCLGLGASLLFSYFPAREASLISVSRGLDAGSAVSGTGSSRRLRRGSTALLSGVAATVGIAAWWRHVAEQRNLILLKAQAAAASGSDLSVPFPSAIHESRYMLALVLGTALAMLGLLTLLPAALSRLGASSRLLPVTTRLALRDMARNSHRAVPVIAALMAASAGATTLTFVMASNHNRLASQYQALVPLGDVLITSTDGTGLDLARTARIARRTLPVKDVVPIQMAVQTMPDGQTIDITAHGTSSSCSGHLTACQLLEQVAIGGTELIAALRPGTGEESPADLEAAALDPRMLNDGLVTLQSPSRSDSARSSTVAAYSPAAGAWSYAGLPGVVVSPHFAATQRWAARPLALLVQTTRMPTQVEEDTARTALAANGRAFAVERGYVTPSDLPLLLLAVAAAFVTLAGTCVTVALSVHEQRRDMQTMTSVGASSRQRRLLSGQQSALLSTIAAVAGICLGALLGGALIAGGVQYPRAFPLLALLIQVIGGVTCAALTAVVLSVRTRDLPALP